VCAVVSIVHVTRPAARRIAACLLTGLLTILAGVPVLVGVGTSPAAAAPSSSAPLQVSIQSLSPSVIPRRGRITITGQITNRSDLTWTHVQAYMFTSPAPMRTSEELAAASKTDPTTEVGSRIYQTGLYDDVGDLAPGQTSNYVLSVPRRALQITGEPGVYWVGVHVLGGNVNGRDGIADGRARTFMPLMSPRGPSTTLSLVVPFEGHVTRQPDGRLAQPDAWKATLGSDGRLGRLLSLCATDNDPLTWVVDPAVLDAAASVATGNPPLDLASATGGSTQFPSPSPSGPTPTPGPKVPHVPGLAAGHAPAGADEKAASNWLRGFQAQATERSVLAVPYGNLDVASAARQGDTSMLRTATGLSRATLGRLAINATPAEDPLGGFLPPMALQSFGGATTVLLSDRAVPGAPGPVLPGPAVGGTGPAADHGPPSVVLIDSSASAGGPGPTPRYAALAVRQRVLSEAAVHALSPDRGQPLVVSTPALWDPGTDWRTADFFAGLQVPWLQQQTIPGVLAGASSTEMSTPPRLVYPRSAHRAELPPANLKASRGLSHTATLLSGLLTEQPGVNAFLTKAAMLDSSVLVRDHPGTARALALRTTDRMRSLMHKVRIDGPSFVTLSSQEGSIAVTVVNGLQQPVTVGVKAYTGSPDLSISSPDPVSLGPGQRASVRLHASASDIGVHSVTLLPVNGRGVPVSSGIRFSVRSSQVGLVIWIIMGVGAGVLLLASASRIVRRVRRRNGPGARTRVPS